MSSFFQKLGFGLKKTSLNLSRGITDIFTKESLSEDVITDLEELLYTADVGVKASSEIIGRFSARRFEKGSDITQIKQEPEAEICFRLFLYLDELLESWGSLSFNLFLLPYRP